MIMLAQGQTMPSLSFEMLRVAAGSGTILIKSEKTGIKSLGIKGFQLPTDGNGQLWVHYARQDPSLYVPVTNVLEKTVAPEMIAGKLVLIGTSAVGLNDIKTTPVSQNMPGVEIHAQILESALTGDVISQPVYGIAVEFATALLFGLLVIAFAPQFGPVTLVALGAAFASMLIGMSVYFYTQNRLLIDFTYPLMSTTAVYLTLIFSSFVREQAQRRQIRSAFGQYLSPALVEQLAQSPEKLVLGGEEREMTIMFSDMRGFTSISETYKSDPQGLTALMNRFLTPLTNAILNRKGTIDKYMGDAIMAFWNAHRSTTRIMSSMPARRRSTCWARRRAQPGARAEAKEGGPPVHSAQSASASIPASAWSATWAPTCASTIRCSATASTWPRASKANPRSTDFPSSSAPRPRWRSRISSRSSNLTSSW
jgi:adenylate cyclase